MMGNEGDGETHVRQRTANRRGVRRPSAKSSPASARENQSYGSGIRGIELFFTSPLVVSLEEFNSLRCPRCELGRDGWPPWEKMGKGGGPSDPPGAGTGRPSAPGVPQLVPL